MGIYGKVATARAVTALEFIGIIGVIRSTFLSGV
jgi:hypothetical protein